MGYGPWGHKQLDTIGVTAHTCTLLTEHHLMCTHLYFDSRLTMLIPSTDLLQMGSWFSLVGTHFYQAQ